MSDGLLRRAREHKRAGARREDGRSAAQGERIGTFGKGPRGERTGSPVREAGILARITQERNGAVRYFEGLLGRSARSIHPRKKNVQGNGTRKRPSQNQSLMLLRPLRAAFPSLPSVRIGAILQSDLMPVDQGFVAGCLLFILVGVLSLTSPTVELWLSYKPFPNHIELNSVSVPEALNAESAANGASVSDRHVDSAAAALDISRFETLSFDTHTVRSGETISGIARRYGITVDTLVSFNQISDSRRVHVGTEFEIPSRSGLRHIVGSGESLSAIAERYSVAVEDILDANDLQTTSISQGNELFIPGARMRDTELRLILGELFVRPTTGRLTSGFGNRTDPFTGRRSFHNGVDWANAPGTPIVASMAGRVVDVGRNPVYGNYVIIQHPENFQSMYAHLQTINVNRGQYVSQRQRIGAMGNTGRSTGSHLHFSLFENGRPVDPLRHVH